MSANPVPQTDDEICMVVQWKDSLDSDSPWWKRLYYKMIYTPFMEFSMKVMKIPAPTKATVVDGKHVEFSWLEHQGFFATAEQAEAACLGERWGYKPIIYGRLMPSETSQYDSPWIYPHAKNPHKRAKPFLATVIRSRKKEEQKEQTLSDALTHLNQVLDRR